MVDVYHLLIYGYESGLGLNSAQAISRWSSMTQCRKSARSQFRYCKRMVLTNLQSRTKVRLSLDGRCLKKRRLFALIQKANLRRLCLQTKLNAKLKAQA